MRLTSTPDARQPTRRTRRGVDSLEMALVMPVLLLLTFAGMEYAWYFIAYQEVQHATREATRAGAQARGDQDPVQSAYDRLAEETTRGVVLPSVTLAANAEMVAGPAVQVTVDGHLDPLIGFVDPPTEIYAGSRLLLEVE